MIRTKAVGLWDGGGGGGGGCGGAVRQASTT